MQLAFASKYIFADTPSEEVASTIPARLTCCSLAMSTLMFHLLQHPGSVVVDHDIDPEEVLEPIHRPNPRRPRTSDRKPHQR